ncbi:MAG: spore protease YyaC [Firmicutes bacterium]|nr:spore protease YyaC [Bacillota bacterium]
MSPDGKASEVRIARDDRIAEQRISHALSTAVSGVARSSSELVLVCVGTDRSTGDALGPLVGSKLAGEFVGARVRVYGTLDEPVHAVNLGRVIKSVETDHPGALLVAVDACLGRPENVGQITVRSGPLRPGTGVRKELPAVGSCHVLGIVNIGGFMEHVVLQSTRLGLVLHMAETIAGGLSVYIRAAGFDRAAARSAGNVCALRGVELPGGASRA